MRSLLDGHPELFVIPFESHFFQLAGFWVDNEYRFSLPQKYDPETLAGRFTRFIRKAASEANAYAANFASGLVDPEAFQEKFRPESLADFRAGPELMRLYFDCIRHAAKFDSKGSRFVEKSVENAEFVPLLKSWFPEAKFIHVIRNPYANFVSLRKFRSVNGPYPLINRMIRTFYNNYYFLYYNRALIPGYFVMRYEDLVRDPESTLRKACEFLGIGFDPVLLNPSIGGRPWGGNSVFGTRFSGIDASNLDRWKSAIHPMEVAYLNKAFSFVFQDFDYPVMEPKGSSWKRARGENMSRYLFNRMYRFYLRYYPARLY